MKKRGISDIVATILIVLLALAAVAMIWAFIQPLIGGAGETATLSAKCLQTEVKPTSCIINTTTNSATANAQLTKDGASKITILLEDELGTTLTGNQVDAPPILSTTQVIIANTTALDVTSTIEARGVAIVEDDQGNSQLCTPSPVTFNCLVSQ